ncbi:hypothetical protein PF005_g17846 [Phytophthora fragariae]|uniref:Uncharacterized protein n=1 Tax=Phytophthora fragariae TaxID=53985 RepID=A0A6A4CQZ8_9STRA|nr:hypothetical protein PF003_g4973 [Phytophthora fragariae]KAE8932612.1 hypothetical protein PF009_g17363 [Phytophthora fragariae]KAE9098360.1 hypothetical protein PF007_g16293 [Phytophthora fragariae]KAE9123437.1 hypothetical protein PF006_g17431 [Phytophthora fragariae]KAE9194032.1 hypothetical protein PF005_g17846 [Phytophthora fragariae]
MWRIVSTACLPWSSSTRRFFFWRCAPTQTVIFFLLAPSHAYGYTPSLSSTGHR